MTVLLRKVLLVFVLSLTVILLKSATSEASEVYAGKYFGSSYQTSAGGKAAEYVAGIMLDKKLLDGRLIPHVLVETLMDKYNDNGSFHPAAIKYDIGLKVRIYDKLFVDGSRMCLHPVDKAGAVEQYWMLKLGYEF